MYIYIYIYIERERERERGIHLFAKIPKLQSRLNIYKRLRDFKVPSTVLDNIFSEENDIKILENAFKALVEDGFKEDDAAKEISKMIFKELDLTVEDYSDDEK